MTPFGEHLRKLRGDRNITQKQMAEAIGVSAAYLSALENGKRGKPPWVMVQRLAGYLNIIWDEAEKLQQIAAMSDPRVIVDTSNLSSTATLAANIIAANIDRIDEETLNQLIAFISESTAKK